MAGLSPAQIKTQVSTPNLSNIASPAVDVAESTETSTFPDPAVFTFLPDLYLLISRLAELRNPPPPPTTNGTAANTQFANSTAAAAAATAPDANTQNGSASLTQTVSRDSAQSGSGSLRHVPSAEASIEVRDLPAHVYALRRKIEEAKEVVRGLPDVGRDVGEQEAEMEELKSGIEGLKRRLDELGAIAARGSAGKRDVGEGEDVVMAGVEG